MAPVYYEADRDLEKASLEGGLAEHLQGSFDLSSPGPLLLSESSMTLSCPHRKIISKRYLCHFLPEEKYLKQLVKKTF